MTALHPLCCYSSQLTHVEETNGLWALRLYCSVHHKKVVAGAKEVKNSLAIDAATVQIIKKGHASPRSKRTKRAPRPRAKRKAVAPQPPPGTVFAVFEKLMKKEITNQRMSLNQKGIVKYIDQVSVV